jgi:hypothetical protein
LQRRSTKEFSKVCHSGVTLRGGYSYPLNLIVRFSFSITTTKLWSSNYSEYQHYLYDRICKYKENFLTPIGYRKISKIFNDEGLKTPRNTEFSNSKVHSMYKKGKIREERINRKDIVEVSNLTIEEIRNSRLS